LELLKMEGVFLKNEIERVGGLLNKKEGREGPKGKTALSSSSLP
jgi:hypothetical protein